MQVRSFALALLAAPLLAASTAADAHTVGLSRGEYRAEASSLIAELTFARPELLSTVAGLDRDGDGRLAAEEVAQGRGLLETALLDGLEVRTSTGRCRGVLERVTLAADDGLAVGLRFYCDAVAARFHLRLALLSSLSVGHRHLASLKSSSTEPTTQILHQASPAFELGPAAATGDEAGVAVPLFTLGIEHILGGFDHLAFLLGLILIGGKWRTLLFTVTAFTLGHSVTLALAALGVWTPSPSLVEPLIALSIVYVGVENWFVSDGSRRWLLTFPFGLIHGFGFAGALREVAIPDTQIPLSLLSFNLGVEAGQILVLALILPALARLRRHAWFAAYGVRVISSGIAVAGLAWLVQRVF